MSYTPSTTFNPNQFSLDAASRLRVSSPESLGDYKEFGGTRFYQWDIEGTGVTNATGVDLYKFNMSVTPTSAWLVRQTKLYHAYFAGHSQLFEITFDNFQVEAGVNKRIGAFHSTTEVTPFSGGLDGIWLENDGTTIKFCVYNAGVESYSKPLSGWLNAGVFSSYDWSKFTVMAIDYLWLGGGVARLWFKTADGFVLADSYTHAGQGTGTMTQFPHLPIRYDIRSTGGTGSVRAICASVAAGGGGDIVGVALCSHTPNTGVTLPTAGVKYPLMALSKIEEFEQLPIILTDISVFVQTITDQVLWTLEINPVLSAPLTFTDRPNSIIREAFGDGSITVLSAGTVIAGGYSSYGQNPLPGVLDDSYFSWMGGYIDRRQDEYVLCITPLLGATTVGGTISTKTF